MDDFSSMMLRNFGLQVPSLSQSQQELPRTTATSETKQAANYLENAVNSLEAKGYRPEAIAGILGNAYVETGGSFSPSQKQYGGGKGHGLFQFDFLKEYYDDWRKDRSDTIDTQLDFMHDLIYGKNQDILGKGNAAKLRKALEEGDVKNTTETFMNIFERPGKPHADRRHSSSEIILNFLKGNT